MHLAADPHGMPVRLAVTAGTVGECTGAKARIDGVDAEYLLADRGYDTNTLLAAARARGWYSAGDPAEAESEGAAVIR